MQQNRRYYILDILRFVAATAVVLFHYAFRGYMADGMSTVRYDALAPVAQYGYLGVDLFFIISGFVIANSVAGRTAATFTVARARRLYPAFWAACSLTVLASWIAAQPRYYVGVGRWLANLTLATPLLRAHFADGVYWSLDVEIRFYALVALVMLVGQTHRIMAVLLAWLTVSGVQFVTGVLPEAVGVHLCLQYAPLFVSGAAYSAVAKGRASRWDYAALSLAIPLSLAFTARSAASVASYYNASLDPRHAVFLVGVFHGIFALVAFRRWDSPKWAFAATAGGMTYPLYLIHQNMGYMVLNAAGPHLNRYLLLVLLFLGMCTTSWLIYRYAEPALRRVFDHAVVVVRRAHIAVRSLDRQRT